MTSSQHKKLNEIEESLMDCNEQLNELCDDFSEKISALAHSIYAVEEEIRDFLRGVPR